MFEDASEQRRSRGDTVRLIILRGLFQRRQAWGHQVVDDGDCLSVAFEDFRQDEHLEVCLREEAEAEAVFATIRAPLHLSGEEAVLELMRRMDLAAKAARVSFGFVRRAA